ncbi:MAG: response regulator transcription factor [Chloroflexi bacterium]|nr:response regulator transcription factor [Chloroflexota bacterium]
MKTTQVIIVDDHPMVREGLRGMLATDRAIQVVGEATTGVEAVDLVGRLRPDVVLMDIRMPDMDGLAATRQIKQEHPEVSVIMVTMYDNPDYLFQAVSAGAAGYVLKDVSRFELLQTIRTVMSGGSFLNSDLMTQCLQRLASHGRAAGQEGAGAPERLTAREMEVLKLVTEGLSNKEIAARLTVSVATVKTHVEHIIQKLQVSDRTQAAVAAVTRGLLS